MKRPRNTGDPAPIHDVLPSILKGIRGPSAGSSLDRVRKAWGEVVGPLASSKTRVSGVENGHLKVAVASAAMKHDLSTFRDAEILRGLQERLPDLAIRGVSYRVSAVP